MRFEERVENDGVELGSAPAAQQRESFGQREGKPVDAVTRQRVEHVGDGGDPALERNVLAPEPRRVAGAVVALVMGQRNRGGEVEELRARTDEQLVADRGVPLDLTPLSFVECARLQQHTIRDRDLAYVVQGAPNADALAERLVQAELAGDPLAGLAHPLDVPAGGAVAMLGCCGETSHHFLLRPFEGVFGRRQPRHGVEQLLLRATTLLELGVELAVQPGVA